MLKVLKFGGSSMADAHQLEKVRSIVEADPARRVVVVSAAGKRFKDDHKITDLLYLCHAHLQYGVSCDGIFDMVRSRYLEIRDELGLSTPLEAEFDALRAKMDKGISADELVSRGEYFAARIMADCLGFDFLDSSLWLHFRMDGTVDQEASYQALVHAASGRKVVIPGFYGVLPDGSIHTFSRGGSGREKQKGDRVYRCTDRSGHYDCPAYGRIYCKRRRNRSVGSAQRRQFYIRGEHSRGGDLRERELFQAQTLCPAATCLT